MTSLECRLSPIGRGVQSDAGYRVTVIQRFSGVAGEQPEGWAPACLL
ncbi:hypothetical protein SAMN06265222_11189 [Neorhodopirellula lusitana]|uniref:Uncharacterized protein n=1 Tax=Neorhodopirellula lusitana TaxID=445327 RepID=A0ABY1QEC3_9BACT|nr:hypothetical protein SAMN06265222_11189 [Neorhodopirellula lusitana]